MLRSSNSDLIKKILRNFYLEKYDEHRLKIFTDKYLTKQQQQRKKNQQKVTKNQRINRTTTTTKILPSAFTAFTIAVVVAVVVDFLH
ncbi:hypothetical protein DERF_008353 [Dermatophagoides farinae]|uniref:Uncharacterized protein n=1 Tax=Dermatophagoides farinae TaxID=6954 RepID=A0A922I319_DERFA|nr:hypothetical protein DERF_008353 [Dermatophagoides farinae]